MVMLRQKIADTEHRELFDWWLATRGDRAMPARADFDPVGHPRALPRIFLVEINPTPPHFLNRLCGTGIDEQQGYPMTGRHFEQVFTGELLRFTVDRFADVAFRRLISYHSTIFRMADDGRQTRFTRLLLPLSDDGSRVDMILGSRIQSGDLPRTYETLAHDREARQRYEIAVVAAEEADRADIATLDA